MNATLSTLLSISLISVFLTGFYTPLNPIRNWVVDKYIQFCVRRGLYKTAELSLLITCSKCLAFTATLIYTWNLVDAIIASMLAVLIKYVMDYVTKQ